MTITISGQHLSVGTALQEHAKERVTQVIQKYFPDVNSISIHFKKDNSLFVCDILMKYGSAKHGIIKSHCSYNEIYAAFDISLAKLEKQLRTYKSKLKNHHKLKPSEVAASGMKYVINPRKEHEDDSVANESDEQNSYPVIIAEKSIEILTLSVKDAVMKMDLENLPAVVFKNASNNRFNIVYYRRDGNISWIDCN